MGLPKLTTWKFNASSRPNCYLDQNCDEQAQYFQRLRDDPALAEKELVDVARSAMIHGLGPLLKRSRSILAHPQAVIFTGCANSAVWSRSNPCGPSSCRAVRNCSALNLAERPSRVVRLRERMQIESLRIHNKTALTLTSHAPYPVHCAYHWLHHQDGSMAWF